MQGRKPRLPDTICDYDFVALSRQEAHGKTKLRLLGLAHLQEGKSLAETGRILKTSWISVRNWLARFSREGLLGLKEKPRSGRKSYLADSEIERFKQAVETLAETRPGGRIRGEDIQQLLREEFNANYVLDSVYSVLNRVGMVWISARSMHPNANLAAQDDFKKTSKKKRTKYFRQASI